MKLNRAILSGCLLACLLCGCGTNPVWKQQSFAFAVPSDAPPSNTSTNVVLLRRVEISPLFQSRSFTYRTGEDRYEHDPYAEFLVSPERTLGEALHGRLRSAGFLGQVVEPDSALTPSVVVEAKVSELDGDFRNSSQPLAQMAVHFIIYDGGAGGSGRILLDKTFVHGSPMERRTPAALMAGWDDDLRQIIDELKSDYAQTDSNGRR
jgi:hypothetical protein